MDGGLIFPVLKKRDRKPKKKFFVLCCCLCLGNDFNLCCHCCCIELWRDSLFQEEVADASNQEIDKTAVILICVRHMGALADFNLRNIIECGGNRVVVVGDGFLQCLKLRFGDRGGHIAGFEKEKISFYLYFWICRGLEVWSAAYQRLWPCTGPGRIRDASTKWRADFRGCLENTNTNSKTKISKTPPPIKKQRRRVTDQGKGQSLFLFEGRAQGFLGQVALLFISHRLTEGNQLIGTKIKRRNKLAWLGLIVQKISWEMHLIELCLGQIANMSNVNWDWVLFDNAVGKKSRGATQGSRQGGEGRWASPTDHCSLKGVNGCLVQQWEKRKQEKERVPWVEEVSLDSREGPKRGVKEAKLVAEPVPILVLR